MSEERRSQYLVDRDKKNREVELDRFDKMSREVYRTVGLPVTHKKLDAAKEEDRAKLLAKVEERRKLRSEVGSQYHRLPEYQQALVKFISPDKNDDKPHHTELLDRKEAVRGIMTDYDEHSIDRNDVHEKVHTWVSNFPRHSSAVDLEATTRLTHIEEEAEFGYTGLCDVDATTDQMITNYSKLHELRDSLHNTVSHGVPVSEIKKQILRGTFRKTVDTGMTTDVIAQCGFDQQQSTIIPPEGCRVVPQELLRRNNGDNSDSDGDADENGEKSYEDAVKQLERMLLRKSDRLVRSLKHRELLMNKTALRVAVLQKELSNKKQTIAETRHELQTLFETRGFSGPWAENDESSAVEFLRTNLDCILEDMRAEMQREATRIRQKAVAAKASLAELQKDGQTTAAASSASSSPKKGGKGGTSMTDAELEALKIQREDINKIAGISDAMREHLQESFKTKSIITKLNTTIDRLGLQLAISEGELAEKTTEWSRAKTEAAVEKHEADRLRETNVALESRLEVLQGLVELRDEKVDALESKLSTVMHANRIEDKMNQIKKGYEHVITNLRTHIANLQSRIQYMQDEHDAYVKNWEQEKEQAESQIANEIESGQLVYTQASNRLSLELVGLIGKNSQVMRVLKTCLRKEVGPTMRKNGIAHTVSLLEASYQSLKNVEADLISFQPKLTEGCRKALWEDLQLGAAEGAGKVANEGDAEANAKKGKKGGKKGGKGGANDDKRKDEDSDDDFVDPSEVEISALRAQVATLEKVIADKDLSFFHEREQLEQQLEVQSHNSRITKDLLDQLQRSMNALTKTRSTDVISAFNFDKPPFFKPHETCQKGDFISRHLDDVWNYVRQSFLVCKHRLLANVETDSAFEGPLKAKLKGIMQPDMFLFDDATRLIRSYSNIVNFSLVQPLQKMTDLIRTNTKWKTSLRKIDIHFDNYRKLSGKTAVFAIQRMKLSQRDTHKCMRLQERITTNAQQAEWLLGYLGDKVARMSQAQRDESNIPDRIRDLRDIKGKIHKKIEKELDEFKTKRTQGLNELWLHLEEILTDRMKELRAISMLFSSMLNALIEEQHRAETENSVINLMKQLDEKNLKLKEMADELEESRNVQIDLTIRNEQYEQDLEESRRQLEESTKQNSATPSSKPFNSKRRKSAKFVGLGGNSSLQETPLGAGEIDNDSNEQSQHHNHPGSSRRKNSLEPGCSASFVAFQTSTPDKTPMSPSINVESSGGGGFLSPTTGTPGGPASNSATPMETSLLGGGGGGKKESATKKLMRQMSAEKDAIKARGEELVNQLAAAMGLFNIAFDEDAAESLLQGYRARIAQAKQSGKGRLVISSDKGTNTAPPQLAQGQEAALCLVEHESSPTLPTAEFSGFGSLVVDNWAESLNIHNSKVRLASAQDQQQRTPLETDAKEVPVGVATPSKTDETTAAEEALSPSSLTPVRMVESMKKQRQKEAQENDPEKKPQQEVQQDSSDSIPRFVARPSPAAVGASSLAQLVELERLQKVEKEWSARKELEAQRKEAAVQTKEGSSDATRNASMQTDAIVVQKFRGKLGGAQIMTATSSIVEKTFAESAVQTRPAATVPKGPEFSSTARSRECQTDIDLQIPILVSMSEQLRVEERLKAEAEALRKREEGEAELEAQRAAKAGLVEYLHPHRSALKHPSVLHGSKGERGIGDDVVGPPPCVASPTVVNTPWSPVTDPKAEQCMRGSHPPSPSFVLSVPKYSNFKK